MTLNHEYAWLLPALNERSAEAFTQLFDYLYSVAVGYAGRIIDDDIIVEDIASESIVKIWTGSTKFLNMVHLDRHLMVMVRNKCIDHIRKKGRERSGKEELAFLSDRSYQAGVEIELSILAVLNELEERDQQIIRLKSIEELDYEDIVMILEMTNVKAARVAFSRARKRLWERLVFHGIVCAIFFICNCCKPDQTKISFSYAII